MMPTAPACLPAGGMRSDPADSVRFCPMGGGGMGALFIPPSEKTPVLDAEIFLREDSMLVQFCATGRVMARTGHVWNTQKDFLGGRGCEDEEEVGRHGTSAPEQLDGLQCASDSRKRTSGRQTLKRSSLQPEHRQRFACKSHSHLEELTRASETAQKRKLLDQAAVQGTNSDRGGGVVGGGGRASGYLHPRQLLEGKPGERNKETKSKKVAEHPRRTAGPAERALLESYGNPRNIGQGQAASRKAREQSRAVRGPPPRLPRAWRGPENAHHGHPQGCYYGSRYRGAVGTSPEASLFHMEKWVQQRRSKILCPRPAAELLRPKQSEVGPFLSAGSCWGSLGRSGAMQGHSEKLTVTSHSGKQTACVLH